MHRTTAPAFPAVYLDAKGDQAYETGLSAREWIAATIMSGVVAGATGKVSSPATLAKQAVELADALITALGAPNA